MPYTSRFTGIFYKSSFLFIYLTTQVGALTFAAASSPHEELLPYKGHKPEPDFYKAQNYNQGE